MRLLETGRSAALISKRGSLDWLCWPRFDSASIFRAIVDPKIGRRWSIRPEKDSEVRRRYLDNTNVLETTFLTNSGKVALTDFMPVTSEEEKSEDFGRSTNSSDKSGATRAKRLSFSILILRGEITIEVFATRTIHRTANG
jgi:GH15 family glucan-1,4-alpha-glucosidase